MLRTCINNMTEWLQATEHKPRIIRGARQVGKTWLVRKTAQICKKQLIEINFERNPEIASLFSSNNPNTILSNLEAQLSIEIIPSQSLLFLDEIQAKPDLLAKLRWFSEDKPDLAVAAAGSLLDFALEEHKFSMPVGRVGYFHLEPLSFEEFLFSQNEAKLAKYLENYQLNTEIPASIHQKLTDYLDLYFLIGGMPAAINEWTTNKNLIKVSEVHQNLMSGYRDDFAKYAGKLELKRLEEVMYSISKQLGNKFKYSTVNSNAQSSSIKTALNLLEKARLCTKVLSSHGNGLPLASDVNEKQIKVMFLDIGLCSAALGLNLTSTLTRRDLMAQYRGALSEQFIAQNLRQNTPYFIDPKLYYWARDKKGASAEVDYLYEYNANIIPIEVKSGSTGSLKSLHLFMREKKLPLAVRFNSETPEFSTINHQDTTGKKAIYQLLSLPLYMVNQLDRLLEKT